MALGPKGVGPNISVAWKVLEEVEEEDIDAE